MDTERRPQKPQLNQNTKVMQLSQKSVLNQENGSLGMGSRTNTRRVCKKHDTDHCWQGRTVKRQERNPPGFFFFDTKFLHPNAQACFENPANRLVGERTSKASEVQGKYLFDI